MNLRPRFYALAALVVLSSSQELNSASTEEKPQIKADPVTQKLNSERGFVEVLDKAIALFNEYLKEQEDRLAARIEAESSGLLAGYWQAACNKMDEVCDGLPFLVKAEGLVEGAAYEFNKIDSQRQVALLKHIKTNLLDAINKLKAKKAKNPEEQKEREAKLAKLKKEQVELIEEHLDPLITRIEGSLRKPNITRQDFEALEVLAQAYPQTLLSSAKAFFNAEEQIHKAPKSPVSTRAELVLASHEQAADNHSPLNLAAFTAPSEQHSARAPKSPLRFANVMLPLNAIRQVDAMSPEEITSQPLLLNKQE